MIASAEMGEERPWGPPGVQERRDASLCGRVPRWGLTSGDSLPFSDLLFNKSDVRPKSEQEYMWR